MAFLADRKWSLTGKGHTGNHTRPGMVKPGMVLGREWSDREWSMTEKGHTEIRLTEKGGPGMVCLPIPADFPRDYRRMD